MLFWYTSIMIIQNARWQLEVQPVLHGQPKKKKKNTIQKQCKQNVTLQAVVECTILSFCHQKKLSRHPLTNRPHADVRSFRLSKAICLYGWPHSDSSRYPASTVQRSTCGYRTLPVRPFAQDRMPLLMVFSGKHRRIFLNIFKNFFV